MCLNKFPERDWREKQKVMDDLLGTVELQRKDLDNLQKDINAKEKLCSALRVSLLTAFYSDGHHRIALHFLSLDCFTFHKETDDVLGITTK